MKREDLLRRLEERLARGEISEETYREIKARYDAMPEEPEEPEDVGGPGAFPGPEGVVDAALKSLDVLDVVEETIERVMEQVGRQLEEAVDSEEFHARMEDVGRRVREAVERMGPRVEAGNRRIVISGSGVVTADRPVESFKCSGSGRVEGTLRAAEVRISGACRIAGDCECQEFRSSGSVKVAGGLSAQEFTSSGSVHLGADLRASEVTTSGSLVVEGSILDAQEVQIGGKLRVAKWVRTQEFASKGRFEIGEGLEAQEVRIELAGTSRVPLLRAEEIRVKGGRRKGELVADRVEGQEVSLEATRARLVRGREVRIGPYCAVDVVEADELEVHETATVRRRGTPAEPEPETATDADVEEE